MHGVDDRPIASRVLLPVLAETNTPLFFVVFVSLLFRLLLMRLEILLIPDLDEEGGADSDQRSE
jgi:hypothetical protein